MLVFKMDPPVRVRPADDARPTVERPPENVEVPVLVKLARPATDRVPVAVTELVVIPFATLKEPMNSPFPWTDNLLFGDVVPIPTFPPVVSLKSALLYRRSPPVKVSPADDAKPTAEMPPENVEVAVPVTLNAPTDRVPVAVRFPVVIELGTVSEPMMFALPSTESRIPGVVVPMPTLPEESMVNLSTPSSSIVKSLLPMTFK